MVTKHFLGCFMAHEPKKHQSIFFKDVISYLTAQKYTNYSLHIQNMLKQFQNNYKQYLNLCNMSFKNVPRNADLEALRQQKTVFAKIFCVLDCDGLGGYFKWGQPFIEAILGTPRVNAIKKHKKYKSSL